eukprot:7035394-Alexandrium_andersonii.AAC.1
MHPFRAVEARGADSESVGGGRPVWGATLRQGARLTPCAFEQLGGVFLRTPLRRALAYPVAPQRRRFCDNCGSLPRGHQSA